MFEEADYTSSGGDLAELKTYLLGRALWNPLAYTDDDAARDEREFLTAFYGAGAAPHIKQYMEIFVASANATRTYLGESAPVDADYLTRAALLDSLAPAPSHAPHEIGGCDPESAQRCRWRAHHTHPSCLHHSCTYCPVWSGRGARSGMAARLN